MSKDIPIRTVRLIERLELEFPTEPTPNRFPPSGSLDQEEIDEALGGRCWDQLDDSTVGSLSWLNCFYYLDIEQARYYLPAFMRYLLRDLSDRMQCGIWYMNLYPTLLVEEENEFVRSLRDGQRRCVAAFLRLVIASDEPSDASEPKPTPQEWASMHNVHRDAEERASEYAAYRNAARVWAGDAPNLAHMASELSETLRADRTDLLREIEEAFAGVLRGEGTSWRESAVFDLYGTEAKRQQERRHDVDRPWPELVDDVLWNPEAGVGGWSFLDPKSVRYYLPAGMVRCLREFGNWRLECFLAVDGWTEGDDLPAAFSALSFRQIKCVAHFVRWMATWEDEYYAEAPMLKGRWEEARDGFWSAVASWE